MAELPVKHLELYNQFMAGDYTAERNQKSWAVISTYLCIEQTLMKLIKSIGGFTHGRGLSDAVRQLWVASLNHAASIHETFSVFCSNKIIPIDKSYAELGISRIKVDTNHNEIFYAAKQGSHMDRFVPIWTE